MGDYPGQPHPEDVLSELPVSERPLDLIDKETQSSEFAQALGVLVFRQEALASDSEPSKSLSLNREVSLKPTEEIVAYFERQNESYMEQLAELEAQIQNPMEPQTQAVVCIPVAGAQESANIYKTLSGYAVQDVDLRSFEIILMVNAPVDVVEKRQNQVLSTLTEIERAKVDFPQLRVRFVFAALPPEQVRIGNIRKIGTDLALLRQRYAGIDRDILLLSNDADNEGLSAGYIGSYINYFRDNSEKEGAVGNLQFDPNAFVREPFLQVMQEYATRLDQVGFKNGNVDLFGSNSVMKSSIYAAIGGYPSSLRTGEQEWTGNTIRRLRKSKSTLGFVEKALLVTSSRRGLLQVLQKRKEQPGFGNELEEAHMRSIDVNSLPMFDFDNPEALASLKADIEEVVDTAIKAYETGEHLGKNSWYYRNNLEKVGILYEVVGDQTDPASQIRVTDMSKFVQRQRIMQNAIRAGEKNMAKVYETSLAV